MNLPDCCKYCATGEFWGRPEDKCKPEHIMTAKMSDKCPEFGSGFDQRLVPTAYKNSMKKYRLEAENAAS